MEKKYIEDKQGNRVLPITHASAVLDDDGNDVGSLLGAKTDESAFTEHVSDTFIHHIHTNKSILDSISATVGTYETLLIKNESGDVVTFSSDEYYKKQYLAWEKGEGNSSAKIIGSSGNASGNYAIAEGYKTTATSDASHAEGGLTIARGVASHAEGLDAVANGNSSHAEGGATVANGEYSHAEGLGTLTNNSVEHASGQYNISSSASTDFGHSGNTLFSVGNGTAEEARHNAFEIRQNGDIYIVSGSSDIKLQDYLGGGGGSITVDQVLDNTTSASTNPVSSKAVYSAITDNELVWANAYVAMSGAISSHTVDTNVHLTSSEKAGLGAASGITSMAGYSIAGTAADIATTDTLLQAIAKLEKRIQILEGNSNP